METTTLPKPFKSQKVTNSNANEVITNYLIKTGLKVDKDDPNIHKLSRLHRRQTRLVTDEEYYIFPNYINSYLSPHFENHVRHWEWIRKDMIKDGYTFTTCTKCYQAIFEIYTRITDDS